ncbi:hypothetical protein [Salinibius halmophilus]|uniref:hypothetical protein n=1 Tax=Salinibius halmophilus TaxID=1853216 RepID=UPI000E66D9ED|nr:hypothetical protein [Salinibius halmophilus]
MNAQSNDALSTLSQEWVLLQHQFDSYEKHSLYIKFVALALLTTGLLSGLTLWLLVPILAIVWLLDGIWKIFQSRIEVRLLKVEQAFRQQEVITACQFNREFLNERQGSVGLIFEYLRSSLRPTVAYPHALLIVLAIASIWL